MITTKKPELVLFQADKKEECFSCEYSSGKIEASGNKAFAASFLSCAIESGYWPEFLGVNEPCFSLRPLWLLHAPTKDEIDNICLRLKGLGFNALMVEQEWPPSYSPILHSHNIFSIFKPILPPSFEISLLSKEVKEKWKQFFQMLFEKKSVDYLFWESVFLKSSYSFSRDLLLFDLVLEEVSFIESLLPKNTKLIFYLSGVEDQSKRQFIKGFSTLLDHVGMHTLLSFPAVSGKLTSDHKPFSPFWDLLKRKRDVSYTYLLPLYNVGAVNQGNGLWPNFSFDLAKHFAQSSTRHLFAGALGISEKIPKKGSLLDCNLWVFGQSQWKKREVELLARVWFESHRPELNYLGQAQDLNELRACTLLLSDIKEQTEKQVSPLTLERQKKSLEALIARLKVLEDKFKNHPEWASYFRYFFRDACRILLHFIHSFRISFSNQELLENKEPSFWTSLVQRDVIFHQKAVCGEEKEMKKIFDEVY